MIIKISDIPVEGRELDLLLDPAKLNSRVRAVQASIPAGSVLPPDYSFQGHPQSHIKLQLEGTSVLLSGTASAEYLSNCARCAEETTKKLKIPLQVVLKPHTERAKEDEVDDLCLGYYEGDQLDGAGIVEEFILLALPYTVYCQEGCQGLCPHCGVNLNQTKCGCAEERAGDERFAILKQLKIKQS